MAFLDLSLPLEAKFCVLMVDLDDRAYVYDCLPEKEKQLLSYGIINICDEIINADDSGVVFQSARGDFVCILDSADIISPQGLYTTAAEMKDSLKKWLSLSVTIAIGPTVSGIQCIGQSYKTALKLMRQRIYMGKNQIIAEDCCENCCRKAYKFDPKLEEKLSIMLMAKEDEQCRTLVAKIFEEISEAKVSNQEIKKIFMNLFMIPSKLMTGLSISSEEFDKQSESILEKFSFSETMEDIRELILSYYHAATQLIYNRKTHRCSSVIERMKGIVLNRFNQDITVAEIAKEVYLTPTYICMIFKQETGETINEFITKVRMENAIQMLKDERIKLYDICDAVGYAAPSYFTRLFKKYTGLTPSEYREKVLS